MINKITFNDKKVRIGLTKLGRNFGMVTRPLEKSARYMENQARANFPATGRIMSEGWQKLAPSTEKYKAKYYPGQPMMVRTGLLKNSFITMGPIVSKIKGEVEVYNPVSYAGIHQYGMGKLPRRVLLKFMRTHVMEIRKIFEQWLNRTINKSFKA